MIRYWNSDKYKWSYLGITKTASTSVCEAMEIDREEDWTMDPEYPRVFTVIRNPIDRALSSYHHLRNANIHESSFDNYLARLRMGFFNIHCWPQYRFCKKLFNGEVLTTEKRPVSQVQVFHTEALELLMMRFGIESIPVRNAGEYGVDFLAEHMTQKHIDAIAEIYHMDFKLYTYILSDVCDIAGMVK